MKKTDIKYCPFMAKSYNHPFVFLGLFGLGGSNRKHQPCLKTQCELWSEEKIACSIKLIAKTLTEI